MPLGSQFVLNVLGCREINLSRHQRSGRSSAAGEAASLLIDFPALTE
jgi:hypothetical protein